MDLSRLRRPRRFVARDDVGPPSPLRRREGAGVSSRVPVGIAARLLLVVGAKRCGASSVAAGVAVCLVFVAAFAVVLAPAGSVRAAPGSAAPPSADLGRERVDLRTRGSRTYAGTDGGLVSRFFTEPVNYRDEAGRWQKIDSDFQPEGRGFANGANRYRFSVPRDLSEPVRLTDGSAWVEYRLQGATASGAVRANRARYPDRASGVEVAYTADGDSVKETLTLAGPGSLQSFRFALSASAGLTAKKAANGRIDIVDGDDAVKFSLSAPLMWDSSKKLRTSRKIAVDLERADDAYTVEIRPDRGWLEDERREWPVVVDPTITFAGPERDCHIRGGPNSGNGSISYCGTPTLGVGRDVDDDSGINGGVYAGSDDFRALLKFDLGTTIPESAAVEAATLGLYSDGGAAPASITLAAVTRSWTTGVTWDSPDGVDWWDGGETTNAGATTNGSAGAAGWSYWHPTEIVQAWVKGTMANHGVLLTGGNYGDPNAFRSSAYGDPSSNPYLEVSWQPTRTGDHPQATFSRQRLTERSALGVNVSNGNLLLENNDLSIAGTGLDLAVDRFYNSLSQSTGSLGSGWNMGTGQDVRIKANAQDSVDFHDRTGSVLTFARKADGTFEAPPGLHATLRQLAASSYELAYDRSGERLSFTTSGPDGWGRLTAHSDRYNNTIRFAYHPDGVLASITDTQGRTIAVERNAAGRIARLTDPSGRSVGYAYNTDGRLETYTDARGGQTSYAYDPAARVRSITNPSGRVTRITYNAAGRVESVVRTTDANNTSGPTTRFDYGFGSPCATEEAKTVVSDPLAESTSGHSVTYCSDPSNRVTKAVDSSGATTSLTYGQTGDLASVSRPLGGVTNYGFQPATRRLVCVQRGATSVQDCVNATGGLKTVLEYANTDALTKHFPTRITNPQGNTVNVCYNGSTPACGTSSGPAGSVQTLIDGLQNVRRFSYNAKGNPTSQTSPRGFTTSFGYDAQGNNLTSMTPPTGAGLGSWQITPDALSRPRSVTDGKGQTSTYTYDGLDRIANLSYGAGPSFGYTYDGDGNRTSLSDPSGTTTYTHDRLGRLEREDFPGGTANAYSWNAANMLTSLTDAGGTTAYAYDALNRLVSVTEPGDSAATSFAYNADGARTQINYPSGVTVNHRYDLPSGRILKVTNRGPQDPIGGGVVENPFLKSYSYTYKDPAGRDTELVQTSTDQAANKTVNSYDAVGRLTEAVTSGGKSSRFKFVFDKDGNRISETTNRTASTGGDTTTWTYNSAGLPCWRAPGEISLPCEIPPLDIKEVRYYTHDANGSDLDNTRQRYTYNAANQATSVEVGNNTARQLRYRGPGQSKLIQDGTYTLQNNRLGIGARGSTFYARASDGTLLSQRAPTGRRNYLYDGEGSVIGLADNDGQLKTNYSYDPYGHPPNQTSLGDENPFGYRGAYTAGVQAAGVMCGGPNQIGGGFYDAEDGRGTQLQSTPGSICQPLGTGDRLLRGGLGIASGAGGIALAVHGTEAVLACLAVSKGLAAAACVELAGGAYAGTATAGTASFLAFQEAFKGEECAIQGDFSPCGDLGMDCNA